MQTSIHLEAVDISAARASSALAWLYHCKPDEAHQKALQNLIDEQGTLPSKTRQEASDRGSEEACSLPIELIHLAEVEDEWQGVAVTLRAGADWSIENVRVYENPDPAYPELRFSAQYPACMRCAALMPGGMLLMKRIKEAIINAWLSDDSVVHI